MEILVCIDDTDNLDSRGTGELAETMEKLLEGKGWGKTYGVTRHQLLLHQDIPYTSHNSSMCFKANIIKGVLPDVKHFAADFLARESHREADPGLCIAVLEAIADKRKLIEFGYKAKRVVLTKEEAYALADELHIHLSEHGGTGQGVIGALAGAGLRLSDNDGLYKGSHKIGHTADGVTVAQLCSHAGIDRVRSLDGRYLQDHETVRLGGMLKTALINGAAVILVYPEILKDGTLCWQTCSKQQLMEHEEVENNGFKEIF